MLINSFVYSQDSTDLIQEDIIIEQGDDGKYDCDEILKRRLPKLTELKARLRCELDSIASISGIYLHQNFGVFTHGISDKQMETTIKLLGQFIATKVDARLSIELSNVEIGIGELEKKDEFLDFVQSKRREALGESDQVLPGRGVSLFIEASAIPALIALEFGKSKVNEEVTTLLWDLIEVEVGKVFSIVDEIRIIDPKLLPESAFVGRELFEDTAQILVSEVIEKIVTHQVDKYYTDALIKNTFKKVYLGGFRTYPSFLTSDVSVYYFKVGIDEQLIRSPLTDRMAVQSVHHLAGSGSAPSASLGIVRTLGKDRTFQIEVSAYEYARPFNQPLLELGNQVLRLPELEKTGPAASVKVRYKDDKAKFDVQLRAAEQDGDMSFEARFKKVIPSKKLTTLFVDYAFNEKNKDNIGGQWLFGLLPIEPAKDSGATAKSAVLVALDRQIYEKNGNDIHLTGYFGHEKGGFDLLRDGGVKVDQRNALGVSLSYTVRRRNYDFSTYAGAEINKLKVKEGEDRDLELNIIAGGSFDFGGSRKANRIAAEKKHVMKTIGQYAKASKQQPTRKDEFSQKIYKLTQQHPELKEEILLYLTQNHPDLGISL